MAIPFVDLKTQWHSLEGEIRKKMDQVLDHGFYVMGPEVKECEEALAEYIGCQYAITCSSGTDALVMALMAADIGPGDEVITSGFSFFASGEAISLVGAKPVFLDIDVNTYNINTDLLEQAITAKTKAIIPVALYGQPADMDAVNKVAAGKGLIVIEDAAQSFGGTYQGKKSGHLSSMGCTSFFPAKPLGCYGDGGAIFTDDKELADRLTEIRVHGSKERYIHTRMGINGRMDTLQCAILLPKIKKFAWELEQRQKLADDYTQAFKDLSGLRTPTVSASTTSAWAQYTLWADERDQLQKRLKELEVPTAIHYPKTLAQQPVYEYLQQKLPIAEKAAEHVISLPMHPYMSESDLAKIVAAVTTALK